jgi:hypothetical protein
MGRMADATIVMVIMLNLNGVCVWGRAVILLVPRPQRMGEKKELRKEKEI